MPSSDQPQEHEHEHGGSIRWRVVEPAFSSWFTMTFGLLLLLLGILTFFATVAATEIAINKNQLSWAFAVVTIPLWVPSGLILRAGLRRCYPRMEPALPPVVVRAALCLGILACGMLALRCVMFLIQHPELIAGGVSALLVWFAFAVQFWLLLSEEAIRRSRDDLDGSIL